MFDKFIHVFYFVFMPCWAGFLLSRMLTTDHFYFYLVLFIFHMVNWIYCELIKGDI